MITITFLDEVNCHVDGLNKRQRKKIEDKLSFSIPGAFMTVDYQMGYSNGKECLIDEDGFTYQYLLDQVIDTLESAGVKEDEIKIVDERLPIPDLPTDPIDEYYIYDETGLILRDHQHEIINSAIINRNGIFDAATSAGKSNICAALSKYFQGQLKSIVLVPTSKLLRQTVSDYKKCKLDVIGIDANIKKMEDRLHAIKNHQHIIMTTKLLHNILKYETDTGTHVISDQQFMILYDEVHKFGDTMVEAFKFYLRNCPVRFGMSGTIPKDKLKKMKIFGCIGNGPIGKVKVKQLLDNKYIAKPTIEIITTSDPVLEELTDVDAVRNGQWDWDMEFRSFNSSERVKTISEFLLEIPKKNTLVLCHPDMGRELSKILDLPMIDKDTKESERDALFEEFVNNRDVLRLASFETSGTGISVNEIYQMVLIDVGKNETHILQGIGRGLRLDGVFDTCHIYDVSSNTYYGKKHRNERLKIYKREHLEFFNSKISLDVHRSDD